jgi:hypothetical protein
MYNLIRLFFLFTLMLPASGTAKENDGTIDSAKAENVRADAVTPVPSIKTWSFTFRLGSFNSSNDQPSAVYPARGQADFELTHYFSGRSGFSFNFGGAGFEARHTGIAAISGAYKFFPAGNGASIRKPRVMPWLGAGLGLYVHEPVFWPFDNGQTINPGGHLTGGVAIPLGNVFELSGELRYAVTSDFRLTSYLMGFGFRF